MKQAMIASGRVSPSEELLRERLEKAGCVDVQTFTLRQPFGPWAKDRCDSRTSIESYHSVIGWLLQAQLSGPLPDIASNLRTKQDPDTLTCKTQPEPGRYTVKTPCTHWGV
jgi:hypothetical protein